MAEDLITGFATPDATALYAQRFASTTAIDFFNRSASDLTLSSFGIGTYVGSATDDADSKYMKTLLNAFSSGINVVDTAIKYRQMRSEKVIGKALHQAIAAKHVSREQVFISSKAGIINIPAGVEAEQYITTEIINRFSLPKESVTHHSHCIEPEFLHAQLQQSLDNLGLETLDCYFIHNPETALFSMSREAFYKKMQSIFEMLEEQVAAGKIKAYGVASWKGFRAARNSQVFIDLSKLYEIANNINKKHNFRFVELPLSLGMPTTYASFAQSHQGRTLAAIKLAEQLGLNVFSSGSLYEGKLPELRNLIEVTQHLDDKEFLPEQETIAVSLPRSTTSITQLFQLLQHLGQSKYPLWQNLQAVSNYKGGCIYTLALDAVRSVPEVCTALVGCDEPDYLEDHLQLLKLEKCNAAGLQALWHNLVTCFENRN